jgi:predicted AlkP superfamily phosphohydrolase/phosphomutase
MAALQAQINPYTGFPLLQRVFRREEVYAGDGCDHAPDLIVQPRDERYLPIGDVYWARHVKRSLHSGWHRRGSYWAGVGPAFAPGRTPDAGRLVDIAATVYHMLGEPAPPHLDGRPLGARRVSVRVPVAV